LPYATPRLKESRAGRYRKIYWQYSKETMCPGKWRLTNRITFWAIHLPWSLVKWTMDSIWIPWISFSLSEIIEDFGCSENGELYGFICCCGTISGYRISFNPALIIYLTSNIGCLKPILATISRFRFSEASSYLCWYTLQHDKI